MFCATMVMGCVVFHKKKSFQETKKGIILNFHWFLWSCTLWSCWAKKMLPFVKKIVQLTTSKVIMWSSFNKRAGECSQKLANWWISNHWPLWSAIKRKPPKHWSLPKMRAVVQHKHHPAPGSPPPPCPSEWQRCPPPGSSATGTALWR